MTSLWEIVGWSGAAAILAAFLAVSMGWMKAGKGFQIANLLGACAFIINGAVHQAWPSVATNVAWCLISAVALLRLRAARQRRVFASDTPAPEHQTFSSTTGQMAAILTGSAQAEGNK